MPELPEVEVSRMGIAPHIEGHKIERVNVHDTRLRWPVPDQVHHVEGSRLLRVVRRAKYLLLETEQGTLILHLGMSGKLRVVPIETPRVKHDHIEIEFATGQCLRLNDPRRFGALLFTETNADEHKLLAMLGPEPLTDEFNADYLFERSRNKKQPIKTFIMDNHQVVGVGNIYASEALFLAGIRPQKRAGNISRKQYDLLAFSIKELLQNSIDKGGTTIKDFVGSDNKPGYFKNELMVYGRTGKACKKCSSHLKEIRLSQRSSVYCPKCQA